MKKEENKSTETPKLSIEAWVALIAEQTKGRDLFAKSTERAKEFWRKVKGAKVY